MRTNRNLTTEQHHLCPLWRFSEDPFQNPFETRSSKTSILLWTSKCSSLHSYTSTLQVTDKVSLLIFEKWLGLYIRKLVITAVNRLNRNVINYFVWSNRLLDLFNRLKCSWFSGNNLIISLIDYISDVLNQKWFFENHNIVIDYLCM